ncbi:MAG TPA: NTP transferase domain-containing protein, partial [Polyangia bacterium]|nr:NTP transferase domain-containing protein [Polyangia bacterium]
MPIGDPDTPNCVARLGPVTLIERTLRVLHGAGIRHVAITVGWQGHLVRQIAATAAAQLGMTVSFFDNPDWGAPNGRSVQAASDFLTERTLLVMADQIAAPPLVAQLCRLPATGDKTVLCVDRDLARVFDIDDATKVKLRGTAVMAIGKQLGAPDA